MEIYDAIRKRRNVNQYRTDKIPEDILNRLLNNKVNGVAGHTQDGDKLGTSMGVYRVMGDIGMVLGPITVSYVADYTGHLTVTFAPFLIPAFLCFVVGILMIWAKDPAAKKQFEEFTIQ